MCILLVGIRSDQTLADTVRLIKTNSSKEIGQFAPRFCWQHGYLAFGVGAPKIAAVRRYILEQRKHHRTMTLRVEMARLLERHGLERVADDGAPTRYRLPVHVVFAVKNRLHLLKPEMKDELYRRFSKIAADQDAKLLEVGGVADHIHLLLDVRPRHSIAGMVKALKGPTSRWLNESFPPFAWQRGYGGFTVSESQVAAIRRYIRRQPEHHRAVSFADEFRHLLGCHGLSP